MLTIWPVTAFPCASLSSNCIWSPFFKVSPLKKLIWVFSLPSVVAGWVNTKVATAAMMITTKIAIIIFLFLISLLFSFLNFVSYILY